MLVFRTTGRFEKEFRLAVKRGKDVSKLKAVIRALVQEVPLDPRLRDHALKGEFLGRTRLPSSFLEHLLFRRIHLVLSSLIRSSCHHGPIDSLRGRSATLITSLRRSLCGTKRAYPLDLFLYGSRCLP